jgi:DNA-binding MarR family transcriptional regulator
MPAPAQPGVLQAKPADLFAATQRAKKTRLRSGTVLGLQRSARRAGKQSAGASAKAGSPEVVNQLRLVMRLLRREEGRTAKGVGAAAQRAIACIECNPGIQVGGLARELGIHQSTASNLVEKLSRGGLVAKRRAVEDHRTVMLYATAKGRTALRAAPAQGPDRLQQALAKLPASTLAALGEHLKGLVAQLQPEGARQA